MLVHARQLPDKLDHALRKARIVELSANRHDQRLAAIAASTNLLRAAVEAGWRVSELAPGMGLKAVTARKRIAAARRVRPVAVGGVAVPEPARRVTIGDYLRLPVEQRDWLTFGEACALTKLSTNGLRNWRLAGLLPNTRWVHPGKGLYLRGDLSRVLAAPPYNNRGHSHAAARQLITAASDTATTEAQMPLDANPDNTAPDNNAPDDTAAGGAADASAAEDDCLPRGQWGPTADYGSEAEADDGDGPDEVGLG